ncbi:MAG: DNA-protecting protein DprA [Lachnospiraceae bacterium]|jgi:DNA processing protein|nr:DNA-protecting protein DprA [Lachnospiraceae bacterium]
MMKEEHFWYWINNIEGFGRKNIRKMLSIYESPENIYNLDYKEIKDFFNNNNTRIDTNQFIESKNEKDIICSYDRLKDKKVSFIYPAQDSYPEKLLCIDDSPTGLYLKGSLPKEEQKSVAIIGARSCTHYGREMARFYGRELAKCGVAVISGLARGIDGMAHRGTLEADGYTLGVLGCGIDVVYPEENYELFMRMEQCGGIISESNLGIIPNAGLFPQRNRIISAMADGILVVEAKKKSGTLITVDFGLEQGKDIFALPGRTIDNNSVGCNNLIKYGANIVTDVSDILDILFCKTSVDDDKRDIMNGCISEIKNKLAPSEKMVYSVLSVEPKYIDDIIYETKLSPGEVCMYINSMVVSGIVSEPVRNYYSIKI